MFFAEASECWHTETYEDEVSVQKTGKHLHEVRGYITPSDDRSPTSI